jgi:hypothetical protein
MEINKMEKLLAVIPPKFLLDHYWEILDLIAWRIFINSENKNHFTFSEIKNKILKEIQESKSNPIRYRECLNSMKVVKEVLNELVKLGLLFQKENMFFKSGIFSEFFYFLKMRIKTSVKNRIPWAIWYFYHSKASNHFLIPEIVNLLSYSDKEFEEEIQYLVKWKNDKWFDLLKRQDKEWHLIEKPYQPTKPILLLDIHYRLHLAILELSKFKNKFTTEEIIYKIRELESESIRKFLKKFGLKCEKEEWYIDDTVIKRIENILFKQVSMEWPLFGIKQTSNSYFKIEGEAHNVYTDMPNQLITYFLEKLYSLTKEYKDIETLYNESIKLKDEFNNLLREKVGNWLSLSIRREFFGKRPFGVQIKINWELFQKFLEKFSKSEDISLEHKYEYLSMCRSEIAWMRGEPLKDLMERRAKILLKDIIKEIDKMITSFIKVTLERRRKYREKLLLKRKIQPLTLAYLPEIILTFKLIRNCVKEGAISTCYREMRKILESLSWVIIDDILLFRKGNEELKRFEFISPLSIPTKEWYNWARDNHLIIKSSSEIFKIFKEQIGEKIKQRYNITNKQLEDSFYSNIRYPLFITLAKSDVSPPNNLKDILYFKVDEKLKFLVKNNLKEVIKTFNSSEDEEFLDKLINSLLGANSFFSLCYPSNSFIIQFLGRMSSLNLYNIYEKYSYFVHSYDKTWQFYPFSSILEFKIFKHELMLYIELITKVLEFYDKELSLK